MRTRVYYFILIEFLIAVSIFLSRGKTSVSFPILSILSITEILIIFMLIKIFIVILKKDKYSVEIFFPLKEGTFLITDGGNSKISRLMNYHYHSRMHKLKGTNQSMKYATDIVRIDQPLPSFLPVENQCYPIFENPVYSPITGEIFKVVNDIEDNTPFIGKYPYNTGNTVVIRDGDLFFLIGHLRRGSITCNVGDKVVKGEIIAKAGNSGYSERPHIHMQLIRSGSENYWSGTGVNMTFRHRNLYKNRVIHVIHYG
jgi:hypothetical protein